MEIRETRLRNLELLVQEFGSQVALAQKADTDPSYISQLIGGWRGRAMGDDLARKIEAATGKTRGWMDTQHPELWSGIMAKAAGLPLIATENKSATLQWLEAEQRELTPESLSAVLALVQALRKLEADRDSPK